MENTAFTCVTTGQYSDKWPLRRLDSLQKCERNRELYRYVGSTMGIAHSTYKFRPSHFSLHTFQIPTLLNTISCTSTISYYALTPSLSTIPLPLNVCTYLVSTAGPINHLLLLQEHLVLIDGCEEGPVLLPCLVQVLHLRLEVVDPFTDLQEPCKQSSYVCKYTVPQGGDISGKDMKPDHTNNV